MKTGTITKVCGDRGFAFITGDDGTADIFVHASQLRGGLTMATLKAGQAVTFDVQTTDKGPRAIGCRPGR